MRATIIVMGVLVLILGIISYSKDPKILVGGLKYGFNMLIGMIPLLVLAFAISGLAQALVPKEVIAKWLGGESGWRGIMFGCLAGAVTPGGPYINFPIAARLFYAGAGMGTVVAFITSWALWSLARLPMEAALISPRFALARFLSNLLFPPMAGFIAQILFKNWH
ncbi:MAG: permease [candidate division Zixibacteria bacterium]|nr:permease [candidate division Zixibacteria bacterium]